MRANKWSTLLVILRARKHSNLQQFYEQELDSLLQYIRLKRNISYSLDQFELLLHS